MVQSRRRVRLTIGNGRFRGEQVRAYEVDSKLDEVRVEQDTIERVGKNIGHPRDVSSSTIPNYDEWMIFAVPESRDHLIHLSLSRRRYDVTTELLRGESRLIRHEAV